MLIKMDLELVTCSPDMLYPTQYYVSPDYEKTTIAVRVAECARDFRLMPEI